MVTGLVPDLYEEWGDSTHESFTPFLGCLRPRTANLHVHRVVFYEKPSERDSNTPTLHREPAENELPHVSAPRFPQVKRDLHLHKQHHRKRTQLCTQAAKRVRSRRSSDVHLPPQESGHEADEGLMCK